MVNRSKQLGTACETAVVRYLRANGWPSAERRALTGSLDQGDVTGTPGICWEVKGGKAAKTASDGQIEAWLVETECERANARADVGILVTARAGIGPDNAGRWWAIFPACVLFGITGVPVERWATVRVHLSVACSLLRSAGYGTEPAALEVGA